MFNFKVVLNKLFVKFKVFSKKLFYIGGSEALPPPLNNEEEDYW